MEKIAVEFRDISIAFDRKKVLENFNLKVMEGEKVLISSPSGSGKTTLLRALMGFNRLDSGEIFVRNREVSEKSINEIRGEVGYLSQKMNFRNLKVEILIKEILSYEKNRNLIYDVEKLKELFQFLNLEDKILHQEVNDLSGGEKQRVGFIILLLLDRDIWVLDEITSSLDRELKEKIVNCILEKDKTVIMVSHDKAEALDKFKKVVL